MDQLEAAPPKKKLGFKAIVLFVTLSVILVAFLVDLFVAIRAGTSMNLDTLNKLLDTLIALLTLFSAA